MKMNILRAAILMIVILGIAVFWITKAVYPSRQSHINTQQEMESAVQKEDVVRLKTLLSTGVNVDIKDRYGWTSLMLAARDGKTASALFLLDNGADPNAQVPDVFPLKLAASGGHFEIAKQLLARGARVDERTSFGNTALIYAAGGGHKEIVKLLAAYGANINAVTEAGNSALMLVHDRPESVDTLVTLINLGADISAKDSNGWTPLFYAVRVRRYRAIQVLLESGADVNAKTIHDQTVLNLAELLKDAELIEFLKQAGAKLGRRY
jgi:ankyrin repeat protein